MRTRIAFAAAVLALGSGMVAGLQGTPGGEAAAVRSEPAPHDSSGGRGAGVAGGPAASVGDRVEGQPATVGAAGGQLQTVWDGGPVVVANPPSFLFEHDSPFVPIAEMRAYLDHGDPEELWARHMAPVLAGPSDARTTADGPPYTPAELEEFRRQLQEYAADMDLLAAHFPEGHLLDTRQRLQEMDDAAAALTLDDLAELKSAYEPYPGFWELPEYMLGVLSQGGRTLSPPSAGGSGPYLPGVPQVFDEPLARPTVPTSGKPVLAGCKAFGGDGNCADCPAAPAGELATVFALETAALVNRATCEFLPPKLLAGSTGIPNPANIICVIIRSGLEIIAAEVKLLQEIHDLCEDQFVRHLILWYLDETVSSRASQQSHDYHNGWEIRTAIEHDLLNVLDSRVSLFQLPAAQGGYLDATDGLSVRWVVTDTIHMQEAAGYTGENIHNAKDEYAAAEALLSTGDYKGAYARYRKSYRAAVRVGREP